MTVQELIDALQRHAGLGDPIVDIRVDGYRTFEIDAVTMDPDGTLIIETVDD
jgi:hypothetical protein